MGERKLRMAILSSNVHYISDSETLRYGYIHDAITSASEIMT